jgi:hypothetical protein
MDKIAPYGKAVTGAVLAALTALLTGLDDSSIDWQEIIVALIAFITVGGAVWAIPNRPETTTTPVR